MTLCDYIIAHPDVDEFTVYDGNYDIEVYFYHNDTRNCFPDNWDEAMNKVAKKLDIVNIIDDETLTVNLSQLIERNLDNGKFTTLFIRNNTDDIMDDIEAIFSGNVSEQWMATFADSLI